MSKRIRLTIDQKQITASEGSSILEAALMNGIEIPNLCYNKKVSHTASCRLCIVRMPGRPGVLPSCTIKAEEGMDITAFDDDLEKIRKTVLDLALSNHNDDCISCVKDGSCDLQDLAFRYSLGKKERRFKAIWESLGNTSDFSSPVLDYDASKCIQCGRCIKACKELQGKGILSFVNRGIITTVATGYDQWIESNCDGCGQCVQICPVGALNPKPIYGPFKRIRRKEIEKKTITTCPYCGVGCQLEIGTKKHHAYGDTKDVIVSVRGAHLVPNYSKTCVKGRFGLDFIDRKERLTHPLIKRNGKFETVSWQEAIKYTAKRLNEIKQSYGSDAIAGLASARCTNEENYLFQKFMRSVIGTNNVDHCARLCHASTVAGLAISFGSGAMTNSIDEIAHSDVILVTGSNTTESHPVIATQIRRAVNYNNTKLIVVDPRDIDLTKNATLWLRQRSGTDVAWVNGLMHVILKENMHNIEFIRERTEGFDEMAKVLEKYTPDYVAQISGIPAEKIIEAARIIGRSKASSIFYAMGITQHSNGTNNVKSLANLAMLTGNIGRLSTGVNPLRGQNNVQGACDMGALPNVYPGYQRVNDREIQSKFEKAWQAKLSDQVGLTVVEMMHQAAKGNIKAMYIMGENPMVSDPNLSHVKQALERLDFLVCQDIFPTETTELADVVLPAVSFAEKSGYFTNTERRVLPINQFLAPIGTAKADWEIIYLLANETGAKAQFKYNFSYDITAEINALTPSYAGITHQRLQQGKSLQWPCPSPDHEGTKFLHQNQFTRGKGLFCAIDHIDPKELPDKEYPFVLSTGRMLYHYHTGTMTRKTKVLTQYQEGAYVEICPYDLKVLGIKHEEKVKVSSRRGAIEITVRETNKVAQGNIFIPFHFAEAAANMLTNDALDPVAKIPEYKVCAIKIEKINH